MVRNTSPSAKKGENGQAAVGAAFTESADDSQEQVGNHYGQMRMVLAPLAI